MIDFLKPLHSSYLHHHGLETLEFDFLKCLATDKPRFCIKNLQGSQAAFAIKIGANAFGQLFGRHCGLSKNDAQRIDFRIILNFHS